MNSNSSWKPDDQLEFPYVGGSVAKRIRQGEGEIISSLGLYTPPAAERSNPTRADGMKYPPGLSTSTSSTLGPSAPTTSVPTAASTPLPTSAPQIVHPPNPGNASLETIKPPPQTPLPTGQTHPATAEQTYLPVSGTQAQWIGSTPALEAPLPQAPFQYYGTPSVVPVGTQVEYTPSSTSVLDPSGLGYQARPRTLEEIASAAVTETSI